MASAITGTCSGCAIDSRLTGQCGISRRDLLSYRHASSSYRVRVFQKKNLFLFTNEENPFGNNLLHRVGFIFDRFHFCKTSAVILLSLFLIIFAL
jgi:hypothetical protein